MTNSTIKASCQLMASMNTNELMMLSAPAAVSSRPHVISSEMRTESEVTRDMIQPTGVLLKYVSDKACK